MRGEVFLSSRRDLLRSYGKVSCEDKRELVTQFRGVRATTSLLYNKFNTFLVFGAVLTRQLVTCIMLANRRLRCSKKNQLVVMRPSFGADILDGRLASHGARF